MVHSRPAFMSSRAPSTEEDEDLPTSSVPLLSEHTMSLPRYNSDGSDDGHDDLKSGASTGVSTPTNGKVLVKAGQAFEQEGLTEYYRPIDSYEGLHRYDPEFQWEPLEERRLVRKIDLRICAYVCLMFFALQLDRGNIQQALAGDMLKTLKLSTNDYNTGQTIFLVSFLFAELPSQLISKKLGPDNWIPIQMVSWSLVASFQALLSGKSSFFVCRALLGLIEGGFIPDTILYLSYWYTSSELPKRLSFFWTSYQSTGIVGALLGFGILHMNGVGGLEGWRWIFALEGILTGLIGIVSWFYLPPSPTQTASKFRGKDGWFSEREEKIMVNRVIRDDPSKGDMHNRQGLTWRNFYLCISDYHMWPVYLIGLTWLVPTVPMQNYLTLQLRGIGFNPFQTSLLTIPAFVIWIIQLLFWTWLSEKINERYLLSTVAQWWYLAFLIPLAVLPAKRSQWTVWALSSLLYASPYFHPMQVALTSRNAGSVRTRTVASALYNMSVQIGSIMGSNIYREHDKPLYRVGNRALIGLTVWNIVLLISTKAFYIFVNKKRERKWKSLSQEERANYLATTTDKGNKRLDFRFSH